jgi:hypothetical protein
VIARQLAQDGHARVRLTLQPGRKRWANSITGSKCTVADRQPPAPAGQKAFNHYGIEPVGALKDTVKPQPYADEKNEQQQQKRSGENHV